MGEGEILPELRRTQNENTTNDPRRSYYFLRNQSPGTYRAAKIISIESKDSTFEGYLAQT